MRAPDLYPVPEPYGSGMLAIGARSQKGPKCQGSPGRHR
ncbi:hypothetical protein JOF57_000176 [Mycolicibacterium lutetiense]|uniref:Uncharacterized protein n=1 Tax=Mycolicibacterium lutetiense TaxID=1641992 RepID=A0ABS4ZLD0_9MYCO|nr:hypothetical protein [Mycolicibacterium lutetiense]